MVLRLGCEINSCILFLFAFWADNRYNYLDFIIDIKHMKKTLFITLGLLLVVVMVGASCGQKAAEEKIENDIESATNGDAEVDLDDNSVKVNTNEATFEAGESVDLPEDFPSDVFVIDGTIIAAVTVEEGDSYSLNIQTSKSVSDAKAEYEEELEADGWDINVSMDLGGSSTMSAEKDDRLTTITISEVDSVTTVIQTTTKNE